MTALRELAERWKEYASDETMYVMGVRAGIHKCADELLAILDAEGDGGAVTELVRTAPEQIYLQISDNQGDHEEAFPANYGDEITWCADSVLDCEVKYVRADLAHPNPARSGVARDGEEGCVVAVGRLISDLRDELKHRHDVDVYDDTTDSLLSRSIIALEHFAKGERHER